MPSTNQAKAIQRKLGRNGPTVNALGLGCMGMSAFYTADQSGSTDTLKRALELGCTFWDTADVYGNNEEFLSDILKTRRNEVFLCTKFAIQAGEDGMPRINGSPEYVRSACERSLKRLGVDKIDLYYQHRVDRTTPIEETVKAMAELVKEGKVRYLGLSECSAQTLRRAYAVHPIAAVQVEYSPWTLDIENNGLLDACRELGVSIVAYSPLGRGFLTGRFQKPEDLADDDWRKNNPRFQGENFKKNLQLVERIKAIAEKKGVTPGQLTLAWVLAQGDDFITIPGTTKVKNLEDNWAAQNVQITKEDDAAIRSIVKEMGVAGLRYAEDFMSSVNV